MNLFNCNEEVRKKLDRRFELYERLEQLHLPANKDSIEYDCIFDQRLTIAAEIREINDFFDKQNA
ncbi:MAG: hypothetical protein HUJ96_04605 [Marinilabiliaceae bacterium]|nr:hypothetical protein [Marinilabiliaceae bacterium]